MAFVGAGSASADELTGPAGKLAVGASLDFSLEPGTSALLVDTAGKELDKCSASTVKGKITNAGGAGAAVSGSVETLTWGPTCTFTTTTLKKGGLSVNNGTVSATGEFQITINTVFFGSCIYGVTNGTSLGTLSSTGTFTANATAERFSGSAFACPETSKWTGKYLATEPTTLTYHDN